MTEGAVPSSPPTAPGSTATDRRRPGAPAWHRGPRTRVVRLPGQPGECRTAWCRAAVGRRGRFPNSPEPRLGARPGSHRERRREQRRGLHPSRGRAPNARPGSVLEQRGMAWCRPSSNAGLMASARALRTVSACCREHPEGAICAVAASGARVTQGRRGRARTAVMRYLTVRRYPHRSAPRSRRSVARPSGERVAVSGTPDRSASRVSVARWPAGTVGSRRRSWTTVSAASIRPEARVCVASPTVWRRSVGGSSSRTQRAEAGDRRDPIDETEGASRGAGVDEEGPSPSCSTSPVAWVGGLFGLLPLCESALAVGPPMRCDLRVLRGRQLPRSRGQVTLREFLASHPLDCRLPALAPVLMKLGLRWPFHRRRLGKRRASRTLGGQASLVPSYCSTAEIAHAQITCWTTVDWPSNRRRRGSGRRLARSGRGRS